MDLFVVFDDNGAIVRPWIEHSETEGTRDALMTDFGRRVTAR